ncbi:uncharacterized protein RBU33_023571 isoform 1-T1 [Hipposideros larvatus]
MNESQSLLLRRPDKLSGKDKRVHRCKLTVSMLLGEQERQDTSLTRKEKTGAQTGNLSKISQLEKDQAGDTGSALYCHLGWRPLEIKANGDTNRSLQQRKWRFI